MLKRFARPAYHTLLTAMPPSLSLQVQHFNGTRRWPNLRRPKSFNEKVLHRKLHENNPDFVRLADKLAVKSYVAERAGEKYVVPTLWSGTTFPKDAARRFTGKIVVKSSHTSGDVLFVDCPQADWEKVAATAEGWLKGTWRRYVHERWYGRMEGQIIVEPFLGAGEAPPDYKFFVFDGAPRMIQYDQGRFSQHRRGLFTPEWEQLPVALQYPKVENAVKRPEHLMEMIDVASKLGEGFSFVRVDLYDLPSGPKLGEMTFAPGGGVERFSPASFDEELGKHWTGPTHA